LEEIPVTRVYFMFKDLERTFKGLKYTFKCFERKILLGYRKSYTRPANYSYPQEWIIR
jgi:hypothetical protein